MTEVPSYEEISIKELLPREISLGGSVRISLDEEPEAVICISFTQLLRVQAMAGNWDPLRRNIFSSL